MEIVNVLVGALLLTLGRKIFCFFCRCNGVLCGSWIGIPVLEHKTGLGGFIDCPGSRFAGRPFGIFLSEAGNRHSRFPCRCLYNFAPGILAGGTGTGKKLGLADHSHRWNCWRFSDVRHIWVGADLPVIAGRCDPDRWGSKAGRPGWIGCWSSLVRVWSHLPDRFEPAKQLQKEAGWLTAGYLSSLIIIRP